MRQCITFADVNIIPKFSTVPTRAAVDLSVNRPGMPYVTLPVISANMDTVTGSNMAKAMMKYGATGCLHRFQSIEDNIKMLEEGLAKEVGAVHAPMVSIGLGMKELERAEALRDAGAYTFVIDVNHGANIEVVKQCRQLREVLGNDYGIIVGNFATGESITTFLEHSGPRTIDGIKCGVGGGSICKTRIVTGCGIPQLSALIDCRIPIKKSGLTMIADGGMKTAGDICKAIACGSDFVMLGGMLAGTDETPGELITQADDHEWYGAPKPNSVRTYKKYRGSASKESYVDQGKIAKHRAVEGESFLVPYKGPVSDVLQDIEGGLRGSLSMVGAYNINEYHQLAEFVFVSDASAIEAGAHNSGKKL